MICPKSELRIFCRSQCHVIFWQCRQAKCIRHLWCINVCGWWLSLDLFMPSQIFVRAFGSTSKVCQTFDASLSFWWCWDLCCIVMLLLWQDNNTARLVALSGGFPRFPDVSPSFDCNSFVLCFCFPFGGIVSQNLAQHGLTKWAGKM
jgi:hypothetical protein